MAAIKRSNTKPEIELRSALHRTGLRFRKDLPIRIAGRLIRPDIAFTRRRLVVFIDGCFWHCCPEHGRRPTTNTQYWAPKLQANAERDRLQTTLLEADGWQVLRIWEHEPLTVAVEQVKKALIGADLRHRDRPSG